MTDEIVIAEDMYYAGDGVAIFAEADGILAVGAYDGGYECGRVAAPWPTVLHHTPTAELINELFRRSPPK